MYWKSKHRERKPSPSFPLAPPKMLVNTTRIVRYYNGGEAYGWLTALSICETEDVDTSKNRHDVLGHDFPNED